VSEISTEELWAWLDGDREPPVVVDVREPHEVAVGAIAQALLAPLSAGVGDLVRRVPDGAHVVLVCARGERARQAQSRIESIRYASVKVLRGGMMAWEAEATGTDDGDACARTAVNHAALAHRIPAVLGAVSRFEGQVLTHLPGSPCYACLHPEPPGAGLSRSCAEEGVLGVVPGIVGLLQANEVLKVLLGIGEPLAGRLLTFDARSARFLTLHLERDARCPACAPK
jgi:rhodanese-related sulfurtransferase